MSGPISSLLMSLPKELLDGEDLSVFDFDLESEISRLTASDRRSFVNLDDYVDDYRPNPVWGCLRITKISSSGDCRINLGAPFPPTYIFVQGKDSACVVSRSPLKPEQEEPPAVRDLDRIVFSLADRCFEEFKRSSETPISEKPGDLENFAVVSVRLSPGEIRQEIESKKVSGSIIGMKEIISILKEPSDANEQSAVETLGSKLAKEAPFSYDKTIQAAISAIQCLYNVLFQDDEIEVYAVGEEGRINKLLGREEIGRHLAAINNQVSN